MSNYLTTIGLEVHTQLKTKTKIFCGCELKFGAPPNSSVCPVCLGLPGVLPVLNRTAFFLALRAVLAFRGTPSETIHFDRKNYFYPDLPKGYQISQFSDPIGRGGVVEIETEGKIRQVRLNRIHMEEDAGKLLHDQSPDSSLVDLNRAGSPLIEIVTEPDIESPEEAYQYLINLKAVLKAIGVSDCDMEKGQLRCDANVSLRKRAADPLGTKVEIKNLNSFKAVKAALEYEEDRQAKALEQGEKLMQETRLWDDGRGKTFSMRSKEESHDYRYFPEPDLVPFTVSPEEVQKERSAIPELPKEKRDRFMRDYALSEYDARLIAGDSDVAGFYEEVVKASHDAKAAANWIIGPLFASLGAAGTNLQGTKITPNLLADLMALVASGKVSFQAAKDKLFPAMISQGASPESLMRAKGIEQVSDDSALESWVSEAIKAHPNVVQDFKAGKDSAAMFFVGQVMKQSKGKANPAKVQEIVRKKLKEA